MVYQKIISAIIEVSGVEDVELEYTENQDFGDFSTNVALVNAKKLKKKASEFADEIVKKLQLDNSLQGLISKVEVAGSGFVNIWLEKNVVLEEMRKIIVTGDKYGCSNWGKGKKWLIEHTSPNPNKAMHLGHLRNNVLGMAIANIWECSGVKVVRDAIDNDRGVAIAKLMWGYLRFAKKDGKEMLDLNHWYNNQDEWSTPEDVGVRPDKFVDDLYVKASKEFKENKEVESQVRQFVVDWEKEDKAVWELWKKVLDYSHKGQEMTLKRLGNKWDKVWHEHEHYKIGKEMVREGLEKGIFKKLDDGAIVSNLKKYGITDTILIKSDGTALYITQDIALTKLKKDTFKPDKMFWVIGPEQSLALKQLYAICDQLGIGEYEGFTHISFGWMSIKGQGRMGSRLGNVVYIDDLLDQAVQIIKDKIDTSSFSEGELEETSEKIGVGAVKYSMLKVGRLQDTAFDFSESMNFEGNSGPYLQYTYARSQSVLSRAGKEIKNGTNYENNINKEEMDILRALFRFSGVIVDAAKNYSPNLLCNYLFDLARKYNAFYNKHRIIGSGDTKDSSSFRLELTKATAQVIKNGLLLLGIATPEKM